MEEWDEEEEEIMDVQRAQQVTGFWSFANNNPEIIIILGFFTLEAIVVVAAIVGGR